MEFKGKRITYSELARSLRKELTPHYGENEAKAMVLLLFFDLKGWNQTQLIINGDLVVPENFILKVESISHRLKNREPIQYILGRARFYGNYFKVNSATLIPRPETEQLVDLIADIYSNSKDLNVLDIGTGSGAIAIALALNLPFSNVSGLDISAEALGVAKENAKTLKANVDFFAADVLKWNPEKSRYDVIVSNPPYIDESEKSGMDANVLNFEPHSALFVPDQNPLMFYDRIALIGWQALKEGGGLFFEINPNHANDMVTMMRNTGYSDINVVKDFQNLNRFVYAFKRD